MLITVAQNRLAFGCRPVYTFRNYGPSRGQKKSGPALKRSSAMYAKVPVLFGLRILAAGIITILTATAQTQTATLVGTVTDTSGAVIPAAKLTVVNTETSFLSETKTSAEGGYYVPYLNPGTYRITLEASGFKRKVHDGVIVRSGETPR